MRAEMTQASRGFASCRSALDFVFSEPSELAIVGPDALPMLRLVRATYRPNLVVVATSGDATSSVPRLTDRPAIAEQTTAYLCRYFACERPLTTVNDLAVSLNAQT